MAPPESRSSSDRGGSGSSTLYYNMKTASRPQALAGSKSFSYTSAVSHARTPSENHPRNPTIASPPITSPRNSLNAAQPFAPKLSASASSASSPVPTPRRHLSTTPSGQVLPQSSARTPSPNYFGLKPETSIGANETSAIPRDNWSPVSSSVKSFGAALPQQIPLDANPEFEAFRRQADAHRGRASFSLGSSHFNIATPPISSVAAERPRAPRWHTHGSEFSGRTSPSFALPGSTPLPTDGRTLEEGDTSGKMDVNGSAHDAAFGSADTKRSSSATSHPPHITDLPPHESPAQMQSPFELRRSGLSKVDDRHPRLSMMHSKANPPSPGAKQPLHGRSDTLPVPLDHSVSCMIPPTDLKAMLDSPSETEVLVLDLRVSPQYAQARIKGALNLCIPTTLLKRATFNLEKLQQTFQGDADKESFARWRDVKHIVVYDAASTDTRDATPALNTIKKFTNEGYKGSCHLLRGGFKAFAASYPDLIEQGGKFEQKPGRPTLSLPGMGGASGANIAPVIGGVVLPTAGNTSNAFFSNIRQNQDLVDGVGQMDVNVPHGADMEALPRWLRDAAQEEDHGKRVSDKFLNIERDEQSRMKVAYSYIAPTAVSKDAREKTPEVQLSGIEKGVKNRYKDILPFDHARVKLEGKPEGACDYVNASHIKASRSHKRYIASQGPLPATFEDFWSVIWDQDVRVIVMLTAESEGGQLKCHPYWKDREFGPIKLRALSEKKVSLELDKQNPQAALDSDESMASHPTGNHDDAFGFGAAMAAADLGRRRANTTTTIETNSNQAQQKAKPASGTSGETPYVIIRKFALSHAAHPFAPMRDVTQLHYPSWPDFGTPAQPSHLLALVELANIMQRGPLPVDIPNTLSPRNSVSSATTGERQLPPPPPPERAARSPKKRSRSRASSNLPLAWWEEPESENATHPMLVHCSAGCGRTGTFCTVDSVIDMLKRQRIRNIRRANDNIERKVHKLQAQSKTDPDGDVAMSGLSFAGGFQQSSRGRQVLRSHAFDDAISPGTKSPVSPIFPNIAATSAGLPTSLPISMSISESPSPSPSLSDDDGDDPNLDTSWLDDDTLDLIASTVQDFRGQRLSMVQTLRQFVLCYETVIEWIWRLQECGGPAGSSIGVPGTGAASLRARGRAGTVAHVGDMSK